MKCFARRVYKYAFGDSREISLIEEIKKRNSRFGKFVENQKKFSPP